MTDLKRLIFKIQNEVYLKINNAGLEKIDLIVQNDVYPEIEIVPNFISDFLVPSH